MAEILATIAEHVRGVHSPQRRHGSGGVSARGEEPDTGDARERHEPYASHDPTAALPALRLLVPTVSDAANARGGDRRAGQRAQQDTAERVPEGRAVSRRERLTRELRVALVAFDALDLRVLELDNGHVSVPSWTL